MNTIKLPATCRAAVALAAWAGLILGATTLAAADATYDNYITVSAGGSTLDGNKAAFQKLNQQTKDTWGGLSGFHYGQDLDKNTTLSFDGHALAGLNDIKLDLKLVRNNVGFVDVGYSKYRVWFDGSGGYIPASNTYISLYDDALYIDRSDLWLELGLTPENGAQFDFRYDYTTRKGTKDSTEWGDANVPSTRAIVPTFLRINEVRHIFNAKAFEDTDNTSWEFAGRYETTTQNNDSEAHRGPGSTSDRYLTQTNGSDGDMFMVHGSVETKVGPTLSVSTGVAHYDMDLNINGSRIYGPNYDPVFNPTYAHRQWHDEGFINLLGQTHMSESLANVNLMFTPTETLTIVPSLLAEKTNWSGRDEYTETAVGSAPSFAMTQEDLAGSSNRSFRTLTAMLESHYTGLKNFVFNATLEANGGYGLLDEDLAVAETGETSIARGTDYRRNGQQIKFTGVWYAQPGLNFTAQYYWKGKQNAFVNEYDSVSAAPTSGDRYPGYITHQDYETNDFNVRATWSPILNVHTVTRYDYQETTIRTQEIALAFIESGKIQTNMLSETITWNPMDRLYLQASGNLVYDRTTTPAHQITGAAGMSVLNSDNNYSSGDLAAGYALDDKTDLSATYTYYRAADFVDNSIVSTPYGADQKFQTVSVQLFRRVSAQLNFLLKYTYGKNVDDLSGGQNNFKAHTFYASTQFRF